MKNSIEELIVPWIISFSFLTTNLFLFSTDDISVENSLYKHEYLGLNQGGDGRYIFYAITHVFIQIFSSINTIRIVSFLTFSAALPLLFCTVMKILKIENNKANKIGLTIFLTFGCSLDMYQYVFAYMAYGAAMMCVAGCIAAATGEHGVGVRLILCALLAFVGLGAYQITGTLLFMSASVMVVVPRIAVASRIERPSLDLSAVVLLAGASVGAVLYALTNTMLRAVGASGFAGYPIREQGLRFVPKNLPRYFETLSQLLMWHAGPYDPLLPDVWRVAFEVVMVWMAWRILRLRASGWPIALAAAALAVAVWPDPANLLLGVYWPSARSMAGFALFFGVVCAALWASNEPASPDAQRGRFGHWLLFLVAAGQCVTVALRYQDRLLQQVSDIALAQSILLHASELYPNHDPIHLRLGIDPAGVGSAKPLVYDYGRSLFSTRWSAPALIEHLSGHRVSAEMAAPGECTLDMNRIDYRPDAKGLLVCIGAP